MATKPNKKNFAPKLSRSQALVQSYKDLCKTLDSVELDADLDGFEYIAYLNAEAQSPKVAAKLDGFRTMTNVIVTDFQRRSVQATPTVTQ